jgi:BON domain
MADNTKRRIVVETSPSRKRRGGRPVDPPAPRGRETVAALTIIGAAALATFIALFLTSRPNDPMSSTLPPGQTIPAGSLSLQPTPKPSPTISPSPAPNVSAGSVSSPEPANAVASIPDDAAIQAQIDKTLAADSMLSKLDVSTLVEAGKVTILGSVKSPELKQRVEKELRAVKGVVSIDDQLVVTATTP